jgi:DNA-binding Lrp family transcriptional regulator
LAKSSKETIQNDEIKVLTILEQHAKETVDEIAKRSGLSRQKVSKIIKRLEKDKVIWGYSAITGKEYKDRQSHYFTLLVKRSAVPLNNATKSEVTLEILDDYLPSGVKIEDIIMTHGDWNAIITFYAPNLVSAKKVVESMTQRLGKYTKEYHLLEHLFPIRKNGFKNPEIKNLVDYI